MLRWVALLAVAGACVLAVRWALTRVDALGRVRGFPVYSVSGLALLAVISGVLVVRHDQLEHRLSSVASRLAGKPVTVHCQTASEEFVDAGAELGFVKYTAAGPEPHTVIKHAQCGFLKHYLDHHGRAPLLDELIAVHVLTHESMHMRGLTNEAEAECAAVQRDASTAELLGATPTEAKALAVAYYRTVYPRMPDDYRSSDCVSGGRLDERLATAPW